MPQTAAGVLFTPVDYPAISEQTIAVLADVFEQQHPLIVVPRFGGRRGHPVGCGRELIPEFLALPPESQARTVIHSHVSDTCYVDVEDPTHLEFTYIRRFADAVEVAFPQGRPLRAVHIGGGGFTMPRWLAATRPGSTSFVLELDRAVVSLARARLEAGTIAGLDVVAGDARTTLRALAEDSADLIIGDAFGSLSVPWHLATREFLMEVRRVLRPGGLYLLNVIDNDPRAFLDAEVVTIASVFSMPRLRSSR